VSGGSRRKNNEFAVLDPATEEVLTDVSSASPEDATAAVATAHEGAQSRHIF